MVPVVARAEEPSTTTTSSTSTTSTTVRRATTTTSPVMQFDPEKEPGEEGATDEGIDVSETAPPYDGPVLNVNLSAATFDPRAAGAYQQWNQARAEVEALVVARSGRASDGARLEQSAVAAHAAIAQARDELRANSKALRHYVVSVYINPAMEPDRDSRRGELVAQLRDVLVKAYARKQHRLDELRAAAAAADEAAASAKRFTADPAQDAAIKAGQAKVDALAAALRLYALGDTGTPSGFRFPIAAPYRFGNSWGAPRMIGTQFAHSHQGVDVFADKGSPLVAVEPGTVVRRGTDRLGGLKLWLIGNSGYVYYYAHLDGFVPTVVDGTHVNAGDTVGFVGNTGNAQGGAPHLHFEVHIRGVAVNPYPLLVVASTGDPFNRAH